jgi:hypothetical protein
MAVIELCKFTHGLGLYIRILHSVVIKDRARDVRVQVLQNVKAYFK